jgi:hypothetical protein
VFHGLAGLGRGEGPVNVLHQLVPCARQARAPEETL